MLTGPSTFFARLRHRQVRFVDDLTAALGFDPTAAARVADFARVAAEGRQLFLNRHSTATGGHAAHATSRRTISPSIRRDRHTASNRSALRGRDQSRLATLENPDLMRRFGLILVNADGFDPREGMCSAARRTCKRSRTR